MFNIFEVFLNFFQSFKNVFWHGQPITFLPDFFYLILIRFSVICIPLIVSIIASYFYGIHKLDLDKKLDFKDVYPVYSINYWKIVFYGFFFTSQGYSLYWSFISRLPDWAYNRFIFGSILPCLVMSYFIFFFGPPNFVNHIFEYFFTDVSVYYLYFYCASIFFLMDSIRELLFYWRKDMSDYSFRTSLFSIFDRIGYEVAIFFVISSIVSCSKSSNIVDVVNAQADGWFIFKFPLLFFVPLALVSGDFLGRPFGVPESKDFKSFPPINMYRTHHFPFHYEAFWEFFFLDIVFMGIMTFWVVVIFFGGWLPIFESESIFLELSWLAIKATPLNLFFLLVRGFRPCYNSEQLISISWKILVPFSFLHWLFVQIVISF